MWDLEYQWWLVYQRQAVEYQAAQENARKEMKARPHRGK